MIVPLVRKVDTFTPVARVWGKASSDTRRLIKRYILIGASLIASESQKNAPVMTGALEKSHKVNILRDTTSRFSVEIAVGGEVTISSVGTVDVDEYITFIHEGSYNLGPKSYVKNSSGKNLVGRKFLERAFEENIDDVLETIFDKVMRLIK